MEKSLRHLVSVSLLCVAATSCSEAPQPQVKPASQVKTAEPPYRARGEAAALQLSLSVEAVEADKRLITLKGPRGNVGVYKVGEQVKRLSEIRAGDTITAEYHVGALAELREPTAEEKSAPIAVAEASERATAPAPPEAALGRAVRIVTTIDALDRAAQSLTVKGPQGGTVAVHVEDPAAFEHLKIGQTIIVTFVETLLLSVETPAKKE